MAPRTRRRTGLVTTGLAMLCFALVACAPDAEGPGGAEGTGGSERSYGSEKSGSTDSNSRIIRMAAVGDSITAGDSPDLAGGVAGTESWVSHASDDDIEFVGGWAEWGASTEIMAAAVRDPIDADVLVLLGGTNDLGWVPHAETAENLSLIAERADVEAVVISSIPPLDLFQGAGTQDLNTFLMHYAESQGWNWVDAAEGLREGSDFAPGMSYDGVHLSEQGAGVLGRAIADAVREATGLRKD